MKKKKNNLPIIIPLSLLVIMGAVIPIIAFAQTAGSGGTNTPYVPAEEFNPILTPIDPVHLNSTSTFFDNWCEINESGSNVDAGTWICHFNIEQMYDDIITLWNDEAEVLQVELDAANDKIISLNNTVTTLQYAGVDYQSQLDMLMELSMPDYSKDPTLLDYSIEQQATSSKYLVWLKIQSFYELDNGNEPGLVSNYSCMDGNHKYPKGRVTHSLGIMEYNIECYVATSNFQFNLSGAINETIR